MRLKKYLLVVLNIFLLSPLVAQFDKKARVQDSLTFNYSYWWAYAEKQHFSPAEKAEFVAGKRAEFLREQSDSHEDHLKPQNIIWQPVSTGKYSQNTVSAGPCVNIDFESGTFNGWTVMRGFTPLYNPTVGCCSTTQTPQDVAIVTGTLTDPFGGFPVVYPGGGSFSAKVGSSQTGGFADRIEQTFFVTAANANFTYRYAVVLNDGGHSLADQPRFTSEVIDTLGNPVNCTFYQVSAGAGIPGFQVSPSNGSVFYKTWTNVAVDLTPNIGQNVTLRFTVYDCRQTGHFAYAYVDGLCTNFETSKADTTCRGVPFPMCAPAGFSVTTWNGPGVVNDSNQCILAALPGVYTCTTLLVPGCPGPTFTHTLSEHPFATLIVGALSSGPCSRQYTFTSTSGIPSPGSVVQYLWDFGDGTSTITATSIIPVHNYALPGTYAVKFRTTTNKGCMDSVTQFITIFPLPNIAFTPPSNCVSTVFQFSNTSTIPVGTINSYTWNFVGTGMTSTLTNPTFSYNTSGTYSIDLTAESNQGCTATLTKTLGIFPPPVISFSPSALCDANGTSFAPATSATISSGFLASFNWNFGDGGTSTLSNPVHTYTTAGSYTVNFTAISNHNCSATFSNVVNILPSPNMAFATTSLNACSPNFTFTNNSTIAAPATISSHTWNFGGSNTTTATNPTHVFPGVGSYTVKLIGVSNQGCPDTAVQYVSVYPYPIINFNAPASCESAIFTVSTTAVSGSVTSYAWNFGDIASGAANTSTLQNPTHFYSAGSGTYAINLNIVSNLNCPSTFSTVIAVNPDPVAVLSYTPVNNSACSLPFNFSSNGSFVSSVTGSFLNKYGWNFSTGTSTLANPSFTFPANGTYTVSLTVTSNHSCTATTSSVIMVHPFPAVSFTAKASCQDIPVTFTTASSISTIPLTTSSIVSYFWDYGDSFTGGGPSPVIPAHTYANGVTHTVTFGAVSNMGCSASAVHTIDVHPVPTITFSTLSNLCFGNVTQYNGTTSIPSGTIFAHVWDFGDGGFAGGNASATHSYATSGTYPVTYSVATEYECWSILTKNITIHPLPAASFTTNGGCLNTVSNFIDGSSIINSPPNSITGWNWKFGDGNSSNSQNPAPYTYTNSGTYSPTLTVTSNQSCTNTAIQTITIHPLPTLTFSPKDACVGTSIQFTNSSFVSPVGSITSYTWDFADGTSTTSVNNPSHTYTATQIGGYNVILTGITNQGCAKSSTSTVNVHPYPQATVTPINNSCINDSAKINTNISISAGSISNFSLYFGDGSFTVTPTSSLTFTTPHTYTAYGSAPGGTPYLITLSVTSNEGCTRTVTNNISIYPKPIVNFSSGNYCQRDSTLFTNTSFIAPGYFITGHEWTFGYAGAPTRTTSSTGNRFPASGIYSVTLKQESFISTSLTCVAAAVKTISIHSTPGSNFTSNTVCAGIPTNFNNTTPTLNVTGWSWYFYNTNQLQSVAQNPIFTYTSSGIFPVKLKALNGFGCKDSIIDSVRVYANPTASFVANEACFRDQTLFISSSTAGSGSSLTYSWSTGNINFSASKDPSYQFSNYGVFPVQLTTTSDLGCKNTFVTSVTVNPLPYVYFTNNDACNGKITNFNNMSAVPIGNITSYNWTFGDIGSGANNTSTLQAPSHTYPNSGNYTATLIAITDKNCTADTIRNIIVHSNPLPDFSQAVICVGDIVTFTNNSNPVDGVIVNSYWDLNGDNVIDKEGINTDYKYTVNGNYNVKLMVITQYGCTNEIIKPIYANPKAVASFTSNNKNGCPSLCINFNNSSSSIASGSFSTTWDFGDGSPLVKDVLNPTHCFDSGNYDLSLTLTSDAGCVTKYFNPGYVSVYPLPQAGFLVIPEQVDEDEPVISVKSLATDAELTKYYITDGSSFGTPDFTHYIKNLRQTKPMVVQIVKNKFGCIDTVFKLLEIKPSYMIYVPNVFTPNGDGLNDDFQPKGVGIIKFSMQIFDRWGHQVFKTNDFTTTWDGMAKGGEVTAKEDVYTWKAQVTDIFNKTHSLVGHVSVIR